MPNELSVGGAQAQLLHLAACLRRRGDEVGILTVNHNTAFLAEAAALGVPVVEVEYHSGARGLTSTMSAVRVLRAWRPDAVISFIYQANVVARIAGRLAGVPAVLSSIRNERFGGRHREVLMRATDRLATLTTTNSELAAKRLVEARVVPASRLVVIPNGIDPASFRVSDDVRARTRGALEVDKGDFVWLSAGRLVAQKDYPTMLRAFATAFDGGRRVRLFIAGEGPLRGELEELAAGLGLEGSVEFLGLRNDIANLMAACDAFVLSSAHEGLPNVVMEAMAAARPVVATSVGGVAELVVSGVNGRLVPPDDPIALAHVMAQVTAMGPEARERMGEAGRQRVSEHFSVDHAVNRWLEVLDGALARSDVDRGEREPMSTSVPGAMSPDQVDTAPDQVDTASEKASARGTTDGPEADHALRRRVLHVVMNAGGGLAAAIEDYMVSTPDHEHHLLAEWDSSCPVDGDLARLATSVTELPRRYVARIRSMRSTVERLSPDVIHVHSSFAGAYAGRTSSTPRTASPSSARTSGCPPGSASGSPRLYSATGGHEWRHAARSRRPSLAGCPARSPSATCPTWCATTCPRAWSSHPRQARP